MKTGYIRPSIEFEDFALNSAIAAGCQEIVNMGPEDPSGQFNVCSDYIQPESMRPGFEMMAEPVSGNFYKESCSCYLSAAGGTVFTS